MGKGCSGLRARSRLNILGLELSWGPVRPRLVPPVTDKSGNCYFRGKFQPDFCLMVAKASVIKVSTQSLLFSNNRKFQKQVL